MSAAPTGVAAPIDYDPQLAARLDWDKGGGLVPAIVQHAVSGAVLMLGYMNREALAATLERRRAVFYSRSRQRLWEKGETSGHTQRVVEMRIDCDQDAVWIKVEQVAGACHTGRRSCFYRSVPLGQKGGAVTLELRDERVFDPKAVYDKP